ncbi:hypothetical protein M885DRAFT_618515 [Pelagophyceae sp. CCMP2097]|nr:hypothetical protein M885DRAFT_618515 [Pelagophyceae sp. CCMP2097]
MLRLCHGDVGGGPAVVGCSWVDEALLVVTLAWSVIVYDVSGEEITRMRSWALAPVESERLTVAAVAQTSTQRIVAAHGTAIRCWDEAATEVAKAPRRACAQRVSALRSTAGLGRPDVAIAALADGEVLFFSTDDVGASGGRTLVPLLSIKPSHAGTFFDCCVRLCGSEASAGDVACAALDAAAMRAVGGAFAGIAQQDVDEDSLDGIERKRAAKNSSIIYVVLKTAAGYVVDAHDVAGAAAKFEAPGGPPSKRAAKRIKRDRNATPQGLEAPKTTVSALKAPNAQCTLAAFAVDGAETAHVLWTSSTKQETVWAALRLSGGTSTAPEAPKTLFERPVGDASKKAACLAVLDQRLIAISTGATIELWNGRVGAKLEDVSFADGADVGGVAFFSGVSRSLCVASQQACYVATQLHASRGCATAADAVLKCAGLKAEAFIGEAFIGSIPAHAEELFVAANRDDFVKAWRAAAQCKPVAAATVASLRKAASSADRSAFEALATDDALLTDATGRLAQVVIDLALEFEATALWAPLRFVFFTGRVSFAKKDDAGARIVHAVLASSNEEAEPSTRKSPRKRASGVETPVEAVASRKLALLRHAAAHRDSPDSLRIKVLRFALALRCTESVDGEALDAFFGDFAAARRPAKASALRALPAAEAIYLIHLLTHDPKLDAAISASWLEALLDAKFVALSLRCADDAHVKRVLASARAFVDDAVLGAEKLTKLGALMQHATHAAALQSDDGHYAVETFQLS